MSSERPTLQPALGLVKDRLGGPPPRRAAPAPAKPAAPALVVADDDVAEPATPAPVLEQGESKPKKAPSRAKASDTSTGGTRRTTVSIPQTMVGALREKLRADGTLSHIQFILREIEANADRLAELVAAEKPDHVSGGGLFPDAGGRRGTAQELTIMNLVTTEANLRVIDSLVEASGAESRSQLIRAALRPSLDPN